MSIRNNPIDIKPYTKKELAAIYGISPKSFCTWIKPMASEIGPKRGKFLNVIQVRIIFKHLGFPGTVIE
jgi:hypothetical protein